MHIAGGSTGVTSRDGAPKRQPQYVFDSRRRYFVKNHGWAYAVMTDSAFLSGTCREPMQALVAAASSYQPAVFAA